MFGQRRTDERLKYKRLQQVTAPSQKRYVQYIEMMLVSPDLDYRSASLKLLNSITLKTMPLHNRDYLSLTFIIEAEGKVVYDYTKTHGVMTIAPGDDVEQDTIIKVPVLALKGDISIRFYYFEQGVLEAVHRKPTGEITKIYPGALRIRQKGAHGNLLFFVTFHTSFHNENTIVFNKREHSLRSVSLRCVIRRAVSLCSYLSLHFFSRAIL